MRDQATEIIPPECFAHDGAYNMETYKKSFIVVQHDPRIKVALTELIQDEGHIIFQTDLNYTGMVWKGQNVTSLFRLAENPEVHFVFIPFNMRKWEHRITPIYLRTNGLLQDALHFNKYLDAIVTSFQNRDLFGHLDLHCLKIGVKVHCFWGEATTQTNKIKEEFGWVLQFEALQNRLCWHVNNFTTVDKCDITLVITVSQKCFMTGIEVRRPRPRLPGAISLDGITLMWPFLHVSENLRVVDYYRGEQFQSICMMRYRNHVAAFLRVSKKLSESDTKETICWVPLRWEMMRVHELYERIIPSFTNRDLTQHVMVHRQLLRQLRNVDDVEDFESYVPKWAA